MCFSKKIEASRFRWEREEFFKYHFICKESISVLFSHFGTLPALGFGTADPIQLSHCIDAHMGPREVKQPAKDHTALESRLGLEPIGGEYKSADGRRGGGKEKESD